MKTVLLLSVFALFPGGERERGLLLYREGKFAAAKVALSRIADTMLTQNRIWEGSFSK